jgi:uncharacterized membrane protein YcaP (DUF421 family)
MSDFFHLTMPAQELLVRGTLMYWFLFLIFRFLLRRAAGSAAVPDLLFVVLLGDAAQNGMIGDGHSLADSALLIAVLASWNFALDWLGYRIPAVALLNDPPSLDLVRNGKLVERNLRRENITLEEVHEAMRDHGVESLAKVRRLVLEPNGDFSLIKKRA